MKYLYLFVLVLVLVLFALSFMPYIVNEPYIQTNIVSNDQQYKIVKDKNCQLYLENKETKEVKPITDNNNNPLFDVDCW